MAIRLFTYILVSDSGFAPNPFWGYCTLACCKPGIRRAARVGDIIVGLTSKDRGHLLAYAMEITEVLPFAAYWRDARFARKKPRWSSSKIIERCGDNCYEPLGDNGFRQLPSRHSSPDGTENARNKDRDLGGERVLISTRFWYFGANSVAVPEELSFGIAGRGHRLKSAPEQIQAYRRFPAELPTGVQGPPARWKAGDESYLQTVKPRPERCR